MIMKYMKHYNYQNKKYWIILEIGNHKDQVRLSNWLFIIWQHSEIWNVKRSILYQTTMWAKKLIKRISQHEKQWWSMFQMMSYSTFKPSRTMSSVNRKTDKTTCWKIELLSYHITRVSVKHFNKIEKQNNINFNVFNYEEKK